MKPILFNAEEVRAILEGRKTVTRRMVKPRPPAGVTQMEQGATPDRWRSPGEHTWVEIHSPYQAGDVLWVRETWGMVSDLLGDIPGPVYYADYTDYELCALRAKHYRWRPSSNMPRAAARIFLRVTGVRVERLRKIGYDDVVREGLDPIVDDFSVLWDSTIKPIDRALYGWEANPWVWVIEFERIDRPPEGKANGK